MFLVPAWTLVAVGWTLLAAPTSPVRAADASIPESLNAAVGPCGAPGSQDQPVPRDGPFLPPPAAEPASLSVGGLLAGAGLVRFDDPFTLFFNLRAVPELRFAVPAGRGLIFDGEISVDAWAEITPAGEIEDRADADLEPYRSWLRLSGPRFEARLGLQKLGFGSAALFRPLMWFDSLDPRDPLQLTDGVWGLLVRWFSKGNANVWAWGLLGNNDRRGFDFAPPDDRTPEFGGRLELPLFSGEIGAVFHHRRADIDGLAPVLVPASFPLRSSFPLLSSPAPALPPGHPAGPAAALSSPLLPARFVFSAAPLPVSPVPEDRFGLDGKWDVGVGVWFEGSLIHQHTTYFPRPYQRAFTLGLDYTFSIGRGLTVLAEHFRLASSVRAFSRGDGLSFSGLVLRYPSSLLDQLSAIVSYDWESRDLYSFLSWTRTTDALTLSVIIFSNPATIALYPGRSGAGPLAGTGLEALLAYHF